MGVKWINKLMYNPSVQMHEESLVTKGYAPCYAISNSKSFSIMASFETL